MSAIISPQGKYSFTYGICWFCGHFQSRKMKLMEALEYVQAYIDDLLVITRRTP